MFLRYIPIMRKNQLQTVLTRNELLSFGVMLITVLIANLVASFWNVDPYHEGAIFPTAAGLAQGYNVFDQVSQQYGFLLPLLISFFLKVFGSYLFVSRLVSYVLLVLLAFLTFKVSCIFINRKVALFGSLLWLSVSPIWSYTMFGRSLSGGVWPNHLAMILVLLAILIIHHSRPESRSINFPLAAFIAFLSSQARMEFILVWLLITLYFLFRDRLIFFYWITGSVFAVLAIFIYLHSNSAVDEWFNQTIRVWTLDPPDVPTIDLGFFVSNGLNFIVLALIMPMTLLLYKLLENKVVYPIRILVLIIFLLLLTTVELVVPDSIIILGRNVISIIDFAAQRTLFSYVNVVILCSFILAVLRLFRRGSNNVRQDPSAPYSYGVLWCTAIGVFGVFHNTNADYTSITVAPYLILSLAYFFPVSQDPDLKSFTNFKEYVTAIVVVSLFIFALHLPKQIHEYSTPVLKNLYAQSYVDARNLDARFKQIAKYTKNSKFLMDCQIGLLSVDENGFKGLDKWTWNQQPAIMIANRLQNLKSGDYAVTCHLNESDKSFLRSDEGVRKFTTKFEDGDFSILRVN